ncbi:MAG: DUF1206 domain-containing protein [Nocardioidaceae bacterium]|nr:DUF1206 domain-containing protein [Nocardioidaceae bacterium]
MTSRVEQGKRAGKQARDSKTLETGARAGILAYGVVHLLIAWLALQVAWTHDSQSTDQQGAINAVAQGPLGSVLLWVAGLGLAALAIWQLTEAVWGHTHHDGLRRLASCLGSAGRAVVYALLGYTAISTAAGSSGGGSSEEGITAQVMKETAGRTLVIIVAIGVLAVAGRQFYNAYSKKFTDQMESQAVSGDSGTLVVRLGQVGFAAKGFAIAGVGALLGWAAITFDPKKAGSLDDALSQLLDQPYGRWLVSLAALGFAAFGLYCFAWARYFRR